MFVYEVFQLSFKPLKLFCSKNIKCPHGYIVQMHQPLSDWILFSRIWLTKAYVNFLRWMKENKCFKMMKRSKHLHLLTEEKSVWEKKFTTPLKILESELVHSQRGNFYECSLNLFWQLENLLGVRNVNFIFLYSSFLCMTQNIVQGIKWVHAVIYVQMALGPMKLHFYQTENDNLRLE